MDYYGSDSYISLGLPKITTIPSATTQTQTPNSASSSSLQHSIPPTIDEVLSGTSQPPFTRNHFLQYLLQRHCLENLEFYIEAEKFLNSTDYMEKEYNWKYLYSNFIEVDSAKEINLPCSVRENFEIDVVPSGQFLQEASKIVFDYLHENYVGFISSREEEGNYCLTAPVPVRRQSYSDNNKRHSQTGQTQHLYEQQGRCFSPLSPSESTKTTPIHKPSSITDESEFPFEMSDDEFDQQQQQQQQQQPEERQLSRDRLTSNPILEEVNSNSDDYHNSDNGGRNFSVSSLSSKSNIVGSFKANDSAGWKKLAKKWKWRRSSNSSSE